MLHERRHPNRSRDISFGHGLTNRARRHWIIGEMANGEFREFPEMFHFPNTPAGEKTAHTVAESIKKKYGDNMFAKFMEVGDRYIGFVKGKNEEQAMFVYVEHGVEDGDHGSSAKKIKLDDISEDPLGMD